jgi:hypothetical protein
MVNGLHRSTREEVLMKAIALHQKSPLAQAPVERPPAPRVAVVRRIDSKRPTRVWFLLLPPAFHGGERK